MYIKKLMERGMAVCTFLCMMAAVPAFASNICYLPSGQCGEQSVHATARAVFGGGDDIGSQKDCGAYQTQNTDSWQNPPSQMYKGESVTKAKCKHSCGSDAPYENCVATCTTENNVCYACDTENDTMDKRYAWYCKGSCHSGGYITKEEKEEMQDIGCYSFYQAMYDGYLCYEVYDHKTTNPTIITKDERKAEYDDSCFTFEEHKVDGGVCYIPTPKTCKKGSYLAVVSKEGAKPEKCACKENLLDFKLKKKESKSWSSSVDLVFGPQAQTQHVTIVSTLTGEEGTTDVAYSIKNSTCENIGCKVSNKGNEVTIACGANLTAEEKVCNITAIQNNADIDAANKPIGNLTIGVKVKPDTCGDYSITDNCVGDTKAKVVEGVLSEAGQACYQCLGDKCPEGATSEVPTSRDGYKVSKTEFGTECFTPIPCKDGFSTEFQGVADCGDKQHPDGWRYDFDGYSGDLRCGKCVPATCNGNGYELKCIPEPEIPCADKNSADCPWSCVGPIAAGDDVLFNCNPKVCTEGDTKYQSVADCGKSGNNGWEFTEKGKSGNLICGECNKKLCKGTVAANDKVRCIPAPICDGASDSCGYTFAEGDREWEGDDFLYNGRLKLCTGKKADGTPYDHRCEPQPRCTNPSDANCGYINFKVEIEGDTPKYDSDDKPCESGYKVDTTCTGNFTYEKKGKSGEKECGKCVCNLKAEGNWTVDKNTCTKVCPLQAEGNWTVDNNTCTRVCPLQAEGNWTVNPATCTKECPLKAKANYAIIDCEYVCDLPAKDGYAIENCEYVPTGPTKCQKTGTGAFGDGCCLDTDCDNGDEFPLYCYAAESRDGKSTHSCRECGAFSDCQLYDRNMDRFEKKCADKAGLCTKIGDKKYTYQRRSGKTSLIWYLPDENQVVVNHDQKSDGSWASNGYYSTIYTGKKQTRFTCRQGECTTYDDSYTYSSKKEAADRKSLKEQGKSQADIDKRINTKYELANEIAALGGKGSDNNSKCPAGSSKSYPSGCSADKAVAVGQTPFGSFCWACKK